MCWYGPFAFASHEDCTFPDGDRERGLLTAVTAILRATIEPEEEPKSKPTLVLLPPADAWPDSAWMARLLPAWRDELRGTVRYPAAFEPLA